MVMFHYIMYYEVITAYTYGFPIILPHPNKKEPVLSSVAILI
jgi:hypothetical protein